METNTEIKTGLDFVQKINELDSKLILLNGKDKIKVKLPDGVIFESYGDYDYVYRKIKSLYEKGFASTDSIR